MADFSVTLQGEGSYILTGVMTFDSVPEIAGQGLDLFTSRQAVISLDLSGVSRIDSAGIAQLIEWMSSARRLGLQIKLMNLPAQAMSLIKVSGLEDILGLAAA